jgi:uncharacterized protein (DUF4415 family)
MNKKNNTESQPEADDAFDFSQGKRGSVVAQTGKTRITIWVDNDVLRAFRETAEEQGRGYQTTMNDVLRDAIMRDETTAEARFKERVRAVVRDELAHLHQAS